VYAARGQVPDTADVMEAQESGRKRERQGTGGESGVKMWLDQPAPTPTQPDGLGFTPTNNKENTPAGKSSDKRRRLATDLEEDSGCKSRAQSRDALLLLQPDDAHAPCASPSSLPPT
jgi:hypothetical protein